MSYIKDGILSTYCPKGREENMMEREEQVGVCRVERAAILLGAATILRSAIHNSMPLHNLPSPENARIVP